MTGNAENVDRTLSVIPDPLRTELLKAFNNIVENYRERRWEPAELNGGKLCEIVYTILKGHVDGTYPTKVRKPTNIVKACHDLEKADKTKFNRSVRIQIPKLLIALYEIRNNRNVGHVGGDLDPNHMDSALVLQIAKWIVAELIRMFHNVDSETASRLVDMLSERTMPLIWAQGEVKRVLNPKLSFKDKTLTLLYTCNRPEPAKKVFEWVEHSNLSVFRKTVLTKLHKKKFIEYNLKDDTVQLLPPGVVHVEEIVTL